LPEMQAAAAIYHREMDDIAIRPAVLDDILHILHHRHCMFWDMGNQNEDAHRLMLASAERFLRDALPGGAYRGWLAETPDRRVIAGAGVTIVSWPGSPDDPAPRRGWIQNVYTEPEYRRRGLARRLVQTVVEWCRAEGFANVSLHASVYGRALYEELGFRQTNEMRLRLRE
jgi:GNAT superfamily N-acetyltransferase